MGRLEAVEHLELDTVAAWPQTGALAARVGALVPMSSVVGELASKGCDMSQACRPPLAPHPPPTRRLPPPAPAPRTCTWRSLTRSHAPPLHQAMHQLEEQLTPLWLQRQ